MSTKKWVQHRSGDGEKWEVYQGDPDRFKDLFLCVKDNISSYVLPKSEYVECSPPEGWEDVTAECEVRDNSLKIIQCDGEPIIGRGCYRLRKVSAEQLCGNQWAFIVEKRQP